MDLRSVTTAEQLLTVAAPGRRFELVAGRLRAMSPAGHWHGAVIPLLTEFLGRHVRLHRLGCVYGAETGFLLSRDPDTVLAPDLAFVRRERVAPAGPGFFPGPPDLAVEVVSPGESSSDVEDKALSWLAYGVRLVWIIDPRQQSITAYDSRGEIRTLSGDEELTANEVVPGFLVPVSELFPALPPR